MTNNEKWEFIKVTLNKLRDLSDEFDTAHRPLMIAPESPLIDPVLNTQSLLIDALEKFCGDGVGNISWYAFECDFGRDAKEAGQKSDMRVIDTVERLRWLCELEETDG